MLDRRQAKWHVDRQLSQARETLPPRLRKAFDKLLQERGLLTPDPAPYFDALGHPLLELPVWVVGRLHEDGVETPAETLADVLGISILGYLHIRAQDDWLDGASREDPTLIALAEALIALSHRLLVAVVGPSARFWTFYGQVLSAYAESLLHTEELRRTDATVSRSAFEQLLAQSRPLVIPSAALLDGADRWELRHSLEEFVFTATAVSQLFNDLTDLYRDRRMGQPTWTLEAIGEPGADRLWLEAVATSDGEGAGRIQERIGEALSFHQRSARAARALGLTAAESWLAERQAALEGLLSSLRGSLIATFVRRMTESGADRSDHLQAVGWEGRDDGAGRAVPRLDSRRVGG
jgi:hypothetical protein